MINNPFAKVLASLPIVILALYFLPFLGVCLLLFRFFVYNRKRTSTCIILIVLGLLCMVPKLTNSIFKTIKFSNNIATKLNDLVGANLYKDIIKFGKFSITVGVIFIIISIIMQKVAQTVTSKLGGSLQEYIKKEEQKDYEIRKENDYRIQQEKEKVKNMRTITCKHCGADNVVTDKVGKCKYCRRTLE